MSATHQRHITGRGRKAAQHPQSRCVNTMLVNLKTAIAGTYHSIKHDNYGNRHLAELSYRFNRGFESKHLLPKLLNAAAVTSIEWWDEHTSSTHQPALVLPQGLYRQHNVPAAARLLHEHVRPLPRRPAVVHSVPYAAPERLRPKTKVYFTALGKKSC